MNKWTRLSIEYANQRSYLDDLFKVYPTIPEGIREINKDVWAEVEKSFKKKNNDLLIRQLLNIVIKVSNFRSVLSINFLWELISNHIEICHYSCT